jgi:hypothetical protein
MKKIIALMVLFAFIGCSSAFAVNWGLTIGGLAGLATGSGLMVYLMNEGMDDLEEYPVINGVAAGLTLGGLVLTIVGLASKSKQKKIASFQEDNPFRYLMLGVMPNSVIIGYRRSF